MSGRVDWSGKANGTAIHGRRVIILGAGLAGLAAATALAPRGFQVHLVEARGRVGGRASSFQDSSTGQLIDTCQHVSMGCCTNLAHFCRTVGISHFLQPQPCLYFMTPDRRVSRLEADALPAPLHLARSFLSAHYLSPLEKLRVAWGLAWLQRAPVDHDPPCRDWLAKHGQTGRTIDRFWGTVLTSALNELPERVGLRYARKVFIEGLLRHRRGFEVELPSVPLARLYGEELQGWLSENGARLSLHSGVRSLHLNGDHVERLELRPSGFLESDWYIAAVPFNRLLDLLPGQTIDAHLCFGNLRRLETSPITSVHLWYDRPVVTLPHVVLIDCIGQWVFNRGTTAPGEHYVQVVVSAARQFQGLGHDEVQRRVTEEMARLFPAVSAAVIVRARIITEHNATFSAVPGVDQWRPTQETPIHNLFLAGDWTATGWPATMEGAVRSGYLAAEAVLKRTGSADRLLQPDLVVQH